MWMEAPTHQFIIYLDVTFIFNACWSWAIVVALVFWVMCTCSGCTRCHLYCCGGYILHGWWHNQMKIEIMSGNQSDHVILCEMTSSNLGLSFYCAFRQFNTTTPCTDLHFDVLISLLFKQGGRYALSGFELSVAGRLFISIVRHACLFAKLTTHLKP